MVWYIKCCDTECDKTTSAKNIVSLITKHVCENGYFRCATCKGKGYIKKSYKQQGDDEKVWKPFLLGVITLGKCEEIYQPFIFLCSNSADSKPTYAWFCYYKRTPITKGKKKGKWNLKLGHGPGGPPVLAFSKILWLVDELKVRKLL